MDTHPQQGCRQAELRPARQQRQTAAEAAQTHIRSVSYGRSWAVAGVAAAAEPQQELQPKHIRGRSSGGS
eukprot:311389-Alexandrium_andersonii.AAC.1